MRESNLCVLGLGGQSVFMEVPHFHAPGETLRCESLYTEPGGKGYNQAVAAARLGARVAFIGAVGDDGDGALCRERLLQETVEPLLETIAGIPTAYACILTDARGENRVTVCGGAAIRLSAAFVASQERRIAQSDALLLSLEVPQEANEAAMDIAQRHGVPVILNPAPYRPTALPFWRKASLLTPNRHEAACLLGLPETAATDELQAAFLASGFPRTVITLGGEGALVLEGGKAVTIPATPCATVDTTGAGDCFTAALAIKLSEGDPLRSAAAFATAAAGRSVTKKHVLQSLPYRNEVTEYRRTL